MFVAKDSRMVLINKRASESTKEYIGKAIRDFDTEDDWWPIVVDQDSCVFGISAVWHRGDEIPARKGLTTLVKVLD
ncbi:MAG: hypothetical protein M0R06_25620 [Sphaerochaeta sp.]|jgi:hypothetical protein|nr:hypothetical protein [Sphaerochaeta sp.]